MAKKTTHRRTPTLGGGPPVGPSSEGFESGSASLESTLPPMPLKKLLASDGAGVYVLSQDPELIDSVTAAGGEQFPIHIVPTFEKLCGLVERAQCKIALLDADLLSRGLRKNLTELRVLEPTLVILLAAPRETAEKLIGLLSERTIHRLLIKPAAVGITRLLIESAVSKYLQIRAGVEGPAAMPITAPRRRSRPASKPSDGLAIDGGRLHGGRIDSNGDHRVAMAFAIASLISDAPIEILNTDQVATSFPTFSNTAAEAGIGIEVHDGGRE
jgi:hypothetical protein